MKLVLLLFLSAEAFASANIYCELARKYLPVMAPVVTYFELDLDGDLDKDLFLSIEGKSERDFRVFLNVGNNYSPAGSVLIHPSSFQLVKLSGAELPAVLGYLREKKGKGRMVRHEFKGIGYLKVAAEVMDMETFNRRISPEKVSPAVIGCAFRSP